MNGTGRMTFLIRAARSRLHEPASVTALQLITHAVAVAVGLILALAEPVGVVKVVGPTLTYATGAALTLGGGVGAWACWRGAWWLERIGLISATTGYLMLAPAIIITQPMSPQVRVFLVLAVSVAVLDSLKRYHAIRWAYLDPAR